MGLKRNRSPLTEQKNEENHRTCEKELALGIKMKVVENQPEHPVTQIRRKWCDSEHFKIIDGFLLPLTMNLDTTEKGRYIGREEEVYLN